MEKSVHIAIDDEASVSGLLHAPEHPEGREHTAVILAHGAGNDMNNPLLAAVSHRLADEGFTALRFNFPYKEKGKKAPDSQAVLIRTWRAAERFLREESGVRVGRLICGGKSMGGRIASQMTAEWLLACDGLVFLGYPLHPAGKKDRLRDAHLYGLHVPMLFFAGTRDPLCDLDLLRGVLSRVDVPCILETVDGGDHSFNVPKSTGLSRETVYGQIAARTVEWVESTASGPGKGGR